MASAGDINSSISSIFSSCLKSFSEVEMDPDIISYLNSILINEIQERVINKQDASNRNIQNIKNSLGESISCHELLDEEKIDSFCEKLLTQLDEANLLKMPFQQLTIQPQPAHTEQPQPIPQPQPQAQSSQSSKTNQLISTDKDLNVTGESNKSFEKEKAKEYSHMEPRTLRFVSKLSKSDIVIPDLNLSIGNHELLSSANLKIFHGERYGLIASNGAGKSTLLHRIYNKLIQGIPADIRIELVEQEVEGDNQTSLEKVLLSNKQTAHLIKREQALLQFLNENNSNSNNNSNKNNDKEGEQNEDESVKYCFDEKNKIFMSRKEASEELELIYEELALSNADEGKSKAIAILLHFGFNDIPNPRSSNPSMHAPTKSLSGGWRMRVALACALFNDPDFLLLDEPTNHLDLGTILWLQEFLTSSSNLLNEIGTGMGSNNITLLIVSHDAAFLDSVCTEIIFLHNKSLLYYPGNYSSFVRARTEKEAFLSAAQEALDMKKAHIKASIEKMKSQAKKTGHPEQKLGLVASREKKLGRMGLEKTIDGKKFNAQKHSRRIGSENDSPLEDRNKGRIARSLLDRPPKEVVFNFKYSHPDTITSQGISTGTTLITLKNVSFKFDKVDKNNDANDTTANDNKGNKNSNDDDNDDKNNDQNNNDNNNDSSGGKSSDEESNREPASKDNSNGLLFENINFQVNFGDKIAILGPNGIGKSSLLNLLSGSLQPLIDENSDNKSCIITHSKLKIGLFTQHHVDQLNLSNTAVEHIRMVYKEHFRVSNNLNEGECRALLGKCGIIGNMSIRPMSTLSGGEKSRVVFASLALTEPHLLLLDEPTNHLDIESIQALCNGLKEFVGAIVLISHNQSLLSQVCDKLYVIHKKKGKPAQLKKWPMDLEQYIQTITGTNY